MKKASSPATPKRCPTPKPKSLKASAELPSAQTVTTPAATSVPPLASAKTGKKAAEKKPIEEQLPMDKTQRSEYDLDGGKKQMPRVSPTQELSPSGNSPGKDPTVDDAPSLPYDEKAPVSDDDL